MTYNNLKYLKGLIGRYRSLVIIYFVLWIVWWILKAFYFKIDIEFYKNLFVSFTEDLAFFGIGFLSLILGSKLARDEPFSIRVQALANGKYANKDAEHFLKANVEDVMTYIKQYTLTININKISPDHKFIYIHVTAEYIAVNMCEDENVKLNVTGSVVPSPPVNGEFGQVTHHTVEREGLDTIYFINLGEVRDLKYEPDNIYSKKSKIPIKANSSATVRLCYEIWLAVDADIKDKTNNWFFHKYYHYCENASYFIVNNLRNTKINYTFAYPERAYETIDNSSEVTDTGIVLANKKQQDIAKGKRFQKDDVFELYFKTEN